MRVLVADDEFYARKAILKILEDLDVEVAAGLETGREVLRFLEQDARVDAALLDIRMPELSGLEVAAHIHRFYPQIGVILITGYADFSYAQQAIQYGVKDYITKPIRRETIQLSLTKLLAAQERKAASSHSYSGGEQALECSAEQLSIKELS
ncbi:MAG: response regulator [Acutalibacteraceae bacterium]